VARFVADRMVARLGRWLRLLGEDAEPAGTGEAAPVPAARAGRVVLTRDRRLVLRLAAEELPCLFIAHDRIEAQLRQVDEAYGLGGGVPLSRCSRCNAELTFHAPETVRGRVWPHVEHTQERFGRCPRCGRVYWQASHVGRMAAFVRRALGRDLLGRDLLGSDERGS
jgi:uncharacterized protein